ncbi:RNA polymerase sigma factor [Aquimarina intermedia]|nr:RNA polymerase sigma-70 factor [Aquimarina intermedia]
MKNNNIRIQESLIKGLKDGNKRSYQLLFENHYADLCDYLYKLSSNASLAEDLVQNIFLRLWEQRTSIHIKTSLQAYLFKSCYNEYMTYLRTQKKQTDLVTSLKHEAVCELFADSQTEIKEEKIVQLETAIETLPSTCKKVFKLSKLEQKKHKEIAELLGISTKTVENHITKAFRYLKTSFGSFLSF